MSEDQQTMPAGSPVGRDRPAASLAFDASWSVLGDGSARSGPGGGDCRVIVPSLDAKPPPGLELGCRLRIALHASHPSCAFNLTVTVRGSLEREVLIFAETEVTLDLVLPNWSGGQHRLKLRADPFDASSPGGQADASPPPSATISVLKVELVWRTADHRGKEMLAEAGLAAAKSIFRDAPDGGRRAEAHRLAGLIGEAIRARAPFSVIRLGDGEGRLLAHPGPLTDTEIEIETIWWTYGSAAVDALKTRHGSAGIHRGIAVLQKLIHQAIGSADCIGLPGPQHFENFLAATGSARQGLANATAGYTGVLIAMARHLRTFPPDRLFDTYAIHAIHHESLFASFLADLPYLGIVTHTDRSGEIGEHFGIRTVEHFPIPGHHLYMPSAELHFPDRYTAIAGGLRVPFVGAPFLVAAGYLGKVYCDVIKARGGVAIDIGSVFDGWFGVGRKDAIRNPAMRLEATRRRPASAQG